ncbi:hypothetical protein [Arsukibacterium sp.]|uniref:hypothetical protein n=1 Tax=Arsukibacterium sp. TaxID=1977258 RepID=UPI001BD475D5|nr:hypothetical protein [Arsukibacterium sp.]
MNLNASLFSEIMFVLFVLIVGLFSYYLGRRKTSAPILAGLLGTVLSIFPPFGLIYLVILVFRKDVNSTSAAVNG